MAWDRYPSSVGGKIVPEVFAHKVFGNVIRTLCTMWDMHDSFLTTTQCVKKRWNKSVLFSSQYHSRCNRFRPPRGTEMSKIHIFLAKMFSRDPNKWDYVKKFNIDMQYLIKKKDGELLQRLKKQLRWEKSNIKKSNEAAHSSKKFYNKSCSKILEFS